MGKIIYQPKKKIKQVNSKKGNEQNKQEAYTTPIEQEPSGTLMENIDSVKPVGDTDCDYTLYVEDYAYTYMYQYASTDLACEHSAAIIGEYYPENNEIVICGVIPIRKDKLTHVEEWINEEALEQVHQEKDTYFPNTVVLGWLHMQPGYGTMLSMKEVKVHRDLFNRQGSIMLLVDPVNKIETFYIYEGEQLIEQTGYYIYYDKNTNMQQYMLDNPFVTEQKEDVDDSVVTQFREIGRMRKKEYQQKKKANFTVFAASIVLLAMTAIIVRIGNQNEQIGNQNEELAYYKEQLDLMKNGENQVDELDGEEAVVVISTDVTSVEVGEVDEEVVEVIEAAHTESTGEEPIEVEVVTIDTQETTEIIEEAEVEAEVETEATVTVVEQEQEVVVEVPQEVAEETTEIAAQNYTVYEVQEGDSLRSISYDHFQTELRTKDIMALNDIENGDMIRVGEELKIPQE